uniref:Uncharacterized protein n=1 Tax=Solanum tuberosum TaxID=4113 RepID=M0ZQV1_SOLTU
MYTTLDFASNTYISAFKDLFFDCIDSVDSIKGSIVSPYPIWRCKGEHVESKRLNPKEFMHKQNEREELYSN